MMVNMLELNLNPRLTYNELKLVTENKEGVSNPTKSKNINTNNYVANEQCALDTTSVIYLQENTNINVISSSMNQDHLLTLLKDRDVAMYNRLYSMFGNGYSTMSRFAKIVEHNTDNRVITQKDWASVESSICRFERGIISYAIEKEESNDPVVHKILDALKPKTQKRLDTLRGYLSTKVRSNIPESSKLNSVSNISSIDLKIEENQDRNYDSYTKALLEFLKNDFKWYEWCLNGSRKINVCALIYQKVSSINIIEAKV